MREPDDHVGDLDAGVVDVVLHIDPLPSGAQQANESVAEHRVAQVADMRRFVGIDAGMFDERTNAGVDRRLRRRGNCRYCRASIQPRVDVAGAGDLEASKTVNRADLGDELFGNFLGGLFQPPREFEGQRQRIFAEFDLRRLLDDQI